MPCPITGTATFVAPNVWLPAHASIHITSPPADGRVSSCSITSDASRRNGHPSLGAWTAAAPARRRRYDPCSDSTCVPLRALVAVLLCCSPLATRARARRYYVSPPPATTPIAGTPGGALAHAAEGRQRGRGRRRRHRAAGTYTGFRPRRSGTAAGADPSFSPNPAWSSAHPAERTATATTSGCATSTTSSSTASSAPPRRAPASPSRASPTPTRPGSSVRNCYCHHNSRWGIFTGFARDLLLENNETSYSAIEHGIYVSNSGDRPIVRRNHAHHNNASGIQLNADPAQMGDDPNDPQGDGIIEDALVEANVIHDNGAAGGAAHQPRLGAHVADPQQPALRQPRHRHRRLGRRRRQPVRHREQPHRRQHHRPAERQPLRHRPARRQHRQPDPRQHPAPSRHAAAAISADPSSQVGPGRRTTTSSSTASRDDDDSSSPSPQWRGFGFDAHSFIATPAALFVDAASDDYHLPPPARRATPASPTTAQTSTSTASPARRAPASTSAPTSAWPAASPTPTRHPPPPTLTPADRVGDADRDCDQHRAPRRGGRPARSPPRRPRRDVSGAERRCTSPARCNTTAARAPWPARPSPRGGAARAPPTATRTGQFAGSPPASGS